MQIYLGDPIHCSLGVSDYTRLVSQNMLDSYCYIHSVGIQKERGI